MKIAQVEFARFALPLTRTLRVGRIDLDTRTGGLIRLTTTDGRVGYGEVSPLPGLHRESLDDVEHRLTVGAARLLEPAFADWRAAATTAWASVGPWALNSASCSKSANSAVA